MLRKSLRAVGSGAGGLAKAFSVASWNVRHFKSGGTTSRVADVVAFVKQQNPDVVALYEVEGKEVFSEVTAKLPTYSFHITEGPQVQEILLGVAPTRTAFFTQRTEFNAGVSLLRPGALLTVTVAGKDYPMLFLHTKSGDDPRGLGLRDDMLVRAFDFRRALDKAAPGGAANYLFMGDLNTMGMEYAFVHDRDIDASKELLKLELQAKARKMRMLTKDQPHTWSAGSGSSLPDSNLDHVVAADHLQFKSINAAEVTVRGWPEQQTQQQRDAWIKKYSDHALLYFEVQKV
jgi:endonuclease/exonuclease/phosphatase family metal-dependent hydrolase